MVSDQSNLEKTFPTGWVVIVVLALLGGFCAGRATTPVRTQYVPVARVAVETEPPTSIRDAAPSPMRGADVEVWVNTRNGLYHLPDSPYYGATQEGRYMSRTEALADGCRRCLGE